MVWLPQGQLGFNNILVKMYALKGVITFSPQRFTQGFEGITVYVDGEDEQDTYQGVILEDNREGVSVVYTAESAQFDMVQGHLSLKMSHGVRLEGQGADQRMLSFEQYQVAIPMAEGRWKRQRTGDHVTLMTAEELWQAYQSEDNQAAVAEWNRRLLLPTTVLVLFFFALPLSLTQKRSGKAGSLVAGIALLVLLYNVQLLLHRQVNQGAFAGWIMWAGQGSLLALGVYLWLRAEVDKLPKIFSQAGEWIYLSYQAVMHRLAYRSDKNS
jgi:lipopolysaccharide export LptBFGC system permease protein LptF